MADIVSTTTATLELVRALRELKDFCKPVCDAPQEVRSLIEDTSGRADHTSALAGATNRIALAEGYSNGRRARTLCICLSTSGPARPSSLLALTRHLVRPETWSTLEQYRIVDRGLHVGQMQDI